MRGLKKQRRIQIIVITLISLILATGLIGYAMRDGINLFYSPAQVVENQPEANVTFRLGGLVVENSIQQGQGVHFTFEITDGAQVLPVYYIGDDLPPDLFSEGQGTIAKGHFEDGIFWAVELLAKHDETYMPKEVVDALKEQGVYQPEQ